MLTFSMICCGKVKSRTMDSSPIFIPTVVHRSPLLVCCLPSDWDPACSAFYKQVQQRVKRGQECLAELEWSARHLHQQETGCPRSLLFNEHKRNNSGSTVSMRQLAFLPTNSSILQTQCSHLATRD
jgi:hypothetical protein